MFEEIYNTLHTSLTIASIRYAMAVFHHFIASLMYIREYRSVGSQQLGSSIVDSTIHFMRENIEKHLTLSDFAEYAGFSASHLSAMFKNETATARSTTSICSRCARHANCSKAPR